MKKNSKNIETLKAMVNANDIETLKLCTTSVQVYNLNEGEEYTNIHRVEKVNGRYYMYDFADRRYLMSRQRDAEWFAGEFLSSYEGEGHVIANYINTLLKYGKVVINTALWSRFFDECYAQGVKAQYVQDSMQYVQNGCQEYIVETYRLITPETEPETATEDNTPAEAETATECHRLECRKGGALVEIATGETVGTWGTDEDGFFAQLDSAHPYNYVHIVNDPTEGTETATEGENEPQSEPETASKPTAHSVKRFELWADCRLLQDYTRKGDALNAWAKVCGKYNRAYVADVLDDYRHIVDTI